MAEYEEEFYEQEESPKSSQLIAGTNAVIGQIDLDAGEYEVGDVLIRTGEVFVHGALDSIQSAKEVCVCARKIVIPEGSTGICAGIFSGEVNFRALRLNGESVKNLSAAEQSQLAMSLRLRNLFVL